VLSLRPASNLTSKMFIKDITINALHAQILHLKFTAVSAELHSASIHPEQTAQRYLSSLLWQNSPRKRKISFVFVLLGNVVTSSELCHNTVESRQKLGRPWKWRFIKASLISPVLSLSSTFSLHLFFLFISFASSVTTFLWVDVKISDCWF
jgi:hypothetical protein